MSLAVFSFDAETRRRMVARPSRGARGALRGNLSNLGGQNGPAFE